MEKFKDSTRQPCLAVSDIEAALCASLVAPVESVAIRIDQILNPSLEVGMILRLGQISLVQVGRT